MKKNNMAAKYNLLVLKDLLYQQTLNIYFGKQTVKLKRDFTEVSRIGFLFYFNLQYRSIYATFKLLAQFLFGSALWNNNYSETIHYYNVKNCREKQQKLANLRQKRCFKKELKHSQRFDHVTDDVMSLFWSWKKLSDRTLLFCKFSLCRVIKDRLSTVLDLVSRLFRSCFLPP